MKLTYGVTKYYQPLHVTDGEEFKRKTKKNAAPLAQLVEQQIFNLWVMDSSSIGGTKVFTHIR